MVEKARAIGGGQQGIALSDEACAYIVGTIASDLDLLDHFPELAAPFPPFFTAQPFEALVIPDVPFLPLLERLIDLSHDTDTYFASLAKLHKARLKYKRILESQPLPTLDQVGPRALLEFGRLSPRALAAFLFWRKWIFDIDNRAAQETGYLFEPIIAGAIGGVPASARTSPVRRHEAPGKGRQADCIKGVHAYEFKLRVTIAASGQGRWPEELSFPRDCRESGFFPVLVVLDSTTNPKLDELQRAFEAQSGEVFVGEAAWRHLDEAAGPTMGTFLERYVHQPMEALLKEASEKLPDITLHMGEAEFRITVADESLSLQRAATGPVDTDEDIPDDVDEELPGPVSSIRSRAPSASSANVRRVMQANVPRDTRPEIRLRRALHAQGLRFRKDCRPEPQLRCAADIVFPRQRLCVFVDGCFWHGCPEHFHPPRTNSSWWLEKIEDNRRRDRRKTSALTARGWFVLRFWEHDVEEHLPGVVSRIRDALSC